MRALAALFCALGGLLGATAARADLLDGSFETPAMGAGNFSYGTAGSTWVFANGGGISANGSGFTSANPGAPDGSQVAFLQLVGTATQSFPLAAGTYTVSFRAAQRSNWQDGTQVVRVSVDGAAVGSFQPPNTSYGQSPSYTFTVAGGVHTLQLAGVGSGGSDYTAFVDAVVIAPAGAASGLVNGSFETPGLGAGNFSYGTAGGTWSFANGGGISANGSGFTNANPGAPDGSQVAFLQLGGVAAQSFALTAGNYTISFKAAQRGGPSQAGAQVVRASIDGIALGSFQPPSTSYAQSPSYPFTVAAGVHTLQLAGVGSGGADFTAFVDAVVLQSAAPLPDSATTLTASINPVAVGQTTTLRASVAGSSPTGQVTFKDGKNDDRHCLAVEWHRQPRHLVCHRRNSLVDRRVCG
jgi:hypothetical protein